MKCFYSFDTVTINSPTAVTIGMFDGLHLGHLKVIEGCLSTSQLNQLKTCVITFSNHPADHFTGKRNELLMPMQEKIEAFKNFVGNDHRVTCTTSARVQYDELITRDTTNYAAVGKSIL